MIKVVFLLDCDDCGQSYSRAIVCTGEDSVMWCAAIEVVLHEAWLREGWSTNKACCVCGPCVDANCRMSAWLETAAKEQSNQ
jgi:hypothetical protein